MNLFPPLALAVLAASVPDAYDTVIIDENVQPVSFDCDIAAVSANTYSIRRAYEICAAFRHRRIPVVLGGNHPSIMYDEASAHADAVVVGDGEGMWEHLLADFEANRLQPLYHSERWSFDQLIMPRRDLLSRSYRFSSLETVRGCPFDCDFCSVTRFHGAASRWKPLAHIEKELKDLTGRTLFIVDDNIIGAGQESGQRARKLFELLGSYRVKWMAQASINIADDPEVLRTARDNGCRFFFIGFESLNPEVLKSLNKRLNFRRKDTPCRDIVKRIHDHGISIMGSFIVGTDYDTPETIRALGEFIADSSIDIPNVTVLTPYPGTRVYDRLRREGRLFNDKFWLMDPVPLFTFAPSMITVAEMRTTLLEMTERHAGIFQGMKSFLKTMQHTHSLSIASFSLAERLMNTRTARDRLLSDAHASDGSASQPV